MYINNNFSKVQSLLTRAMTAESLRHTTISNNIANADTPHFKRSDVKFESMLKKALENKSPYQIKALRTHHKHIPFYKPKNYKTIQAKIHLEYDSTYRNDKNNVDIDKEMVSLAKSALRYNAFASITSRYFKKMNIILRG